MYPKNKDPLSKDYQVAKCSKYLMIRLSMDYIILYIFNYLTQVF